MEFLTRDLITQVIITVTGGTAQAESHRGDGHAH